MYKNKLFFPEYDYSKLRGLIKEKLGREGLYAEKIGRTQNYLTNVFNSKSYFEQRDIELGMEVLEIPPEMIGVYFFTKRVLTTSTE